MKTVRFAKVVKKSGNPEVHLLLTDPALDKALQSAVKANRVMTVHQHAVGSKAEHGTVGLEPGPSRQFLVFPKSLAPFKQMRVVGVNYDLLEQSGAKPRKARAAAKPAKPPKQRRPKKDEPSKIVDFPKTAKTAREDEETEWQGEVRKAMDLLEEGKTVAAFKVLKTLVE